LISGLLYSALAALGDLIGGLLVLTRPRAPRPVLAAMVGFGGGFMLAVALVEMLPEVFQQKIAGGLGAVLAGYLIVHLTQHTLTPHFHFGEETHQEAMVSRGIGRWALVGLLPHSFFDGVAISSGFLRSEELGLLVFGAIILHKVPTGVSLASVMIASGNTQRETVLAVIGIAAATLIGAALTPVFAPLLGYGLALATGVTIYVAASNLIPESQHVRNWSVQGGVFAGVIAFFAFRALLYWAVP
jgi:ZIP family zinc transporter/zinc and cadmium transporter